MSTRPLASEPASGKDRLFAENRERADDFNFGADTAAVFDDMLDRSVPFYAEVQRMLAEIVADYAVEGTAIYDLGCSTATTLIQLAPVLPPATNVRLVGIDSSPEMLEIAARKVREARLARPVELLNLDLNGGAPIENASVVMMILTLQFVRPLHREQLVRTIYQGLVDQGCLLLVEKVLGEDSTFNRLFIRYYYEMKKRNGYSELEIAQKREALENVLVPYRLEENRELLQRAGFQVDVFFKWYNFCGIIAMK